MPRAPSLEQRVDPRGIAGARLGAAPSPDYFGANIGDLGASVGEHVYREQTQRANQLALMMADGQLSEAQTQIQVKISKLEGLDALTAPDVLKADWEEATTKVDQGLSNDVQRMAAKRSAMVRFAHLNDYTQKYVASENKKFQATQTDANLKQYTDEARLNANEPDIRDTALFRQKGVLDDYAKTNGTYGTATAAELYKRVTSNTHKEVIGGMLLGDNDLSAKAYLAEHRQDLTAPDLDHAEKLVNVGSSKGEAFRFTRNLLRPNGVPNLKLTRADALEAVAKNLDKPEVVDYAEKMINQHFNEQEHIQAKDLDQKFQAAVNLVQKNPGVKPTLLIDTPTYAELTLPQRKALDSYSEIGTDRVNNDPIWIKANDLNFKELAALSQTDYVTKYRMHLDNAHQSRLDTQRNAAIDRVAGKEVNEENLPTTATLTFKDVIDNTLRTSGLFDAHKEKGQLNDESLTRYVQIEQKAAVAVGAFERANKRKVTQEELQAIVHAVTDQSVKDVFVPGRIWGTNPKKVIDLTTDERGQATVPVGKIPDNPDPTKSERKILENYIRSRGQTITEDKLSRAYAQSLLGNRKLFDQIIDGTDPQAATPGLPPPPPDKPATPWSLFAPER
jgi:hypothetical protein